MYHCVHREECLNSLQGRLERAWKERSGAQALCGTKRMTRLDLLACFDAPIFSSKVE